MTQHDLKQATLGQLLDQAIAAHPDNDAVVYADRDFRLTYREFGDVVDRLGGVVDHADRQGGESQRRPARARRLSQQEMAILGEEGSLRGVDERGDIGRIQ